MLITQTDAARPAPAPRHAAFRQSRANPPGDDRPFVLLVGGSDVHLRADLMDALSDRFRLEAVGSSREAEARLEAAGHRYHGYALDRGVSPIHDLASMVQLAGIMRAQRPDVVHAFDTKPTIWGRLAARTAGVPVIIGTIPGLGAVHSSNGRGNWLVRPSLQALQTLSCRVSDFTILQNPDDRRDLVENRTVRADRSAVIPGSGVRTSAFDRRSVEPALRTAIRAELGASDATVIVTMASRIIRSKGVTEFAEAAERVRARLPDTCFVLVGPDDQESVDRLSNDELRRVGVAVRWLGARSDMAAILAASDVFVLPSYLREGIPRVLLEAASMELPLVATRSPGCSEVVLADETGILVPPRSAGILAEAIGRLVEQPSLRLKFGQRARRLAIERFDLRVIADQLASLYANLLAAPPARRRQARRRDSAGSRSRS